MRYDITRGHLWRPYSTSSSTHSSSQPGGILPGQTTSHENNNYSKSEYTNTQQDLPDQKLPLDVPAFGWWVCFAENTKIMDPYIQCFSSISSDIIITKWVSVF
jgi:hypothetical protein